ncbi:MAG: class I SAM-dependent methyltransferase [Roseiarcus sp.]
MSKYATPSDVQAQRAYYQRTAEHYDAMHVHPDDEHGRALGAFMGLAEVFGPVNSVLDVGAGTGRAMQKLKVKWPTAKVIGIEPVDALREVGYRNGLTPTELLPGDALKLPFEDDSFDYVIETGVLHHISDPLTAVTEMARVARKGVMISDSNNIGQGNFLTKTAKYLLKSVGLWPVVVWAQTRGKMYKTSDADGVFYSFSAFDCVASLRAKLPIIHYMNTEQCDGFNIYRGSSHAMIFCKEMISGPDLHAPDGIWRACITPRTRIPCAPALL